MDEDDNELTGFGAVRRNLGRIQDGIDTYTGERADKPAEWRDESHKVALRLAPSTERILRTVGDPSHPQYIYYRREELENSVKQDDLRPLFSPMPIEEQVRAECGLECFIAGPHDERAVAASLWPWEIACCFIAAQTIAGAEENSAAFWKWRGRLARDGVRPGQVMSFADADRLLRRAVLKGRIRVRRDSDLDAEDIPTSEWPRLAWVTASNGEVHEFVRLLRDGVPCYENPVLVAEEIKAWLSRSDQGAEAQEKAGASTAASAIVIESFPADRYPDPVTRDLENPKIKVEPKARPRGRPPKERDEVVEKMLPYLKRGVDLESWSDDALKATFERAPGTCRKALKIALAIHRGEY